MIYKFDLVCPRCGRESEINAEHRVPPPRVNCGDCLMDDVEIVEFKVVNVMIVIMEEGQS
jgi:ribosomal protein S27AE